VHPHGERAPIAIASSTYSQMSARGGTRHDMRGSGKCRAATGRRRRSREEDAPRCPGLTGFTRLGPFPAGTSSRNSSAVPIGRRADHGDRAHALGDARLFASEYRDRDRAASWRIAIAGKRDAAGVFHPIALSRNGRRRNADVGGRWPKQSEHAGITETKFRRSMLFG